MMFLLRPGRKEDKIMPSFAQTTRIMKLMLHVIIARFEELHFNEVDSRRAVHHINCLKWSRKGYGR